MNKIWTLLLLSINIILIAACKDSVTNSQNEPNRSPKIYVHVTDTKGNPLEGVGIHFYDDFGLFGRVNLNRPFLKTSRVSSVVLLSFTASIENINSVRLEWTTGEEIDNFGFDIMRSENGNDFIKIGFVTGRSPTHKYSFVDENLAVGRYFYKLKDIETNGRATEHEPIEVEVPAPENLELSQNYPNPFDGRTTMRFALPKTERIVLQIRNWWNSETVSTIVDSVLPAGVHSIKWVAKNDDGQIFSSNLYSYHLMTEEFNLEKEFLLIEFDHSKFDDIAPLAKTNSEGNLELNYDILPIGQRVDFTDETGPEIIETLTISDSLHLVFSKQGYRVWDGKVLVDTTKALDLNVQLERKN